MVVEWAVKVIDPLVELDKKLRELGSDLWVGPHEVDGLLQRVILVEHLVAHAGDEHADESPLALRHFGNVNRG